MAQITDTDKLPDWILDAVLQRNDYNLEEIGEMDAEKIVDEWLSWNGIIGYGSRIFELVNTAVAAQIQVAKPDDPDAEPLPMTGLLRHG